MKQLVVISGKGGTGKTVITASFVTLAAEQEGGIVAADCDVDAADLHLLLDPRAREKHEFRSGKTAHLEESACTSCGNCVVFCRFSAIRESGNTVEIDPIACEGCGLCSHICPSGAITMEENSSGEWFISDTDYGPLVHARLGIAEENSGKLVTLVRGQARRLAEESSAELVITDGPPGIGCPVISSITGADLVLVVTEPTMSGLHDLCRVVELSEHFRIRPVVCVNKHDINAEMTQEITEYCRGKGIALAGEIPFDKAVPEALVRGEAVVRKPEEPASRAILTLWKNVYSTLHNTGG